MVGSGAVDGPVADMARDPSRGPPLPLGLRQRAGGSRQRRPPVAVGHGDGQKRPDAARLVVGCETDDGCASGEPVAPVDWAEEPDVEAAAGDEAGAEEVGGDRRHVGARHHPLGRSSSGSPSRVAHDSSVWIEPGRTPE